MDYQLCTKFPHQLLLKSIEPCLSLYMPTHRHIAHQKKDILVFKNLVKEAILSLEQKYSNRDIKPLVSKLKLMEDDGELWNYSQEGLALFATLETMIIYRTNKVFKPIAIVSNSFHIKPLVQYYQAIETFTILALEAESFTLYEGNHHEINPIILADDAKTTLSEMLGTDQTEDYQTHGVYGGSSDGSTYHGHGGRSDGVDIDRVKFFKQVDRFVLEEISKKTKYPLILVAHKEHHFEFKKGSNNPYLLEDTIEGSYEHYKDKELKEKIQNINDTRFNVFITKAIEHYHNLNNKELSSDQLIIVLRALLESRVDTLMIEANKIIPGKIDKEKKQILKSNLNDPQTDDLLDDMVQHAFITGSKVYIIETDTMPTTSGVAATFRY